MAHNNNAANVYPKRVIWMQEEDTLKWVLVGLTDDGEVQDPSDYDDVRVPLPNQPSGRVWTRDEATGKWTNLLVEASKEELHKVETAIRRRIGGQHHQDEKPDEVHWTQAAGRRDNTNNNENKLPTPPTTASYKPPRFQQRGSAGGATIHQRYAQRLSGSWGGGEVVAISEDQEEADNETPEIGEDGIRYHNVKPRDTFNFICLKYKISADALRGANNFVGSTLKNAPKRLVIPAPPKVDEIENNDEEEKKEKNLEKESLEINHTDNLVQRKQPPEVPSTIDSIDDTFAPVSIAPRKQPPPPVSTISSIPLKQPEEEVKYHWVEPDDSLRWICLKYKVNANDLRKANNFTGSNLKLAPKKLIIPKPSNAKNKMNRPPRPRRLNGSIASVDSHGSAALTSSLLTTNSFPLKEEEGDDSSVVGESSVIGGRGEETSPKPSVQGVLGLASSNPGSDTSPPLPETIVEHHAELAPLPYRNLGSHGSEILGSIGDAPASPAPVTTIHLSTAKKLYDQMSYETDSSDSLDGSDDEIDLEAPTYMNGSFRSSKTNKARYHDVRPTDTVEYLCLKYRVSASALRRANIGLTGRNLQTGPKRLIIPPSTSISSNPISYINSSFKTKDTRDTHETETCTTNDDDTNTIALSDGQSTLTDQFASLELHEDEQVIYHDVQPSDTLQGICLRYGISAYELRRANNFRGLNLSAAPDRLAIPKNDRQNSARRVRDFETMSHEEKIQLLIAHLPISRQTKKPLLSYDEARAYLEFNDWNFDQALRNAKVDADWSSQRSKSTSVRGMSTHPGKSLYR